MYVGFYFEFVFCLQSFDQRLLESLPFLFRLIAVGGSRDSVGVMPDTCTHRGLFTRFSSLASFINRND